MERDTSEIRRLAEQSERSQSCEILTGVETRIYDGCEFKGRFAKGEMMARKDRLTRVAVAVGGAMGKADRTARRVAKAGVEAKEELEALASQLDQLKKQLLKAKKRLQKALK